MTNKSFAGLAILCAAAFAVGCNSDYEPGESTASSVAVTSFSLTEDDDVLANLDSVFFSIDLSNYTIYNADSLPYGTNVSRLIPVISTLEGVSLVELTVPRPGKTDTIHDYISNPNDSIDFSNGPVALKITSPDGMNSRTYQVYVNVHKLKSDSITWQHTACRPLPSTFSTPVAQKTTGTADAVWCLSTDGTTYSIATAGHPSQEEWTPAQVSFPFTPETGSFTAAENVLYILSTDGMLYSSTDGGQTWSPTGKYFSNIYGAFGEEILAASGSDIVSYPSGKTCAMPDGFPVSGTSPAVTFSFELSGGLQAVITGGRDAAGNLTDATWAYDGTTWCKVSNTPMPKALEGIAVVPYFTFRESSTWVATKYSTLFAFGGRDSKGALNRTVYTSNDFGMTWTEAAELMQLPEYIPAMAFAQGLVYDSVLTAGSRSTSAWTEYPTACIPYGAHVEHPLSFMTSRSTTPVTSWDCPYIYLFGGVDENGATYNTVWRGVVNRLTYKPLQ